MISHTVYFSLGSNLGDRSLVIRQAIALLAERVGAVCRQSSLMETKPWGFESDNLFLNACVCCTTTLQPREVLEVKRRIEQEMGSTRKSVHGIYHDRVIDIDLLLYDDWHVDEPDLKIPHPLMHQRDFVMRPLREIYPEPI